MHAVVKHHKEKINKLQQSLKCARNRHDESVIHRQSATIEAEQLQQPKIAEEQRLQQLTLKIHEQSARTDELLRCLKLTEARDEQMKARLELAPVQLEREKDDGRKKIRTAESSISKNQHQV